MSRADAKPQESSPINGWHCVDCDPHVEGDPLASHGILDDPDPLLVGLLRRKDGHFIRFHLQALDQHVVRAGDRLDVEMIRQCFEALDQKTQQPLKCDPHLMTNAA
jgi:hypothetical protein